MPSQKFLFLEGVEGHLVSDPHAPARHGDHARYVGWDLALTPVEDPDHVSEHYVKARQVHADHADLRRAVAAGALSLRGEVIAKNHDAARATFEKVT